MRLKFIMNFSGFYQYSRWLIEYYLLKPFALPYISAILIGLGFARFSSSIFLFISDGDNLVNGLSHSSLTAKVSVLKDNVNDGNADSLLGGKLFAAVPEGQASSMVTTQALSIENLKLIGTIEGDPSFARAIIRDTKKTEEPKEYAIGEKLDDAKIINIKRELVEILLNNEKYTLTLENPTPSASQPPNPAPQIRSEVPVVNVNPYKPQEEIESGTKEEMRQEAIRRRQAQLEMEKKKSAANNPNMQGRPGMQPGRPDMMGRIPGMPQGMRRPGMPGQPPMPNQQPDNRPPYNK